MRQSPATEARSESMVRQSHVDPAEANLPAALPQVVYDGRQFVRRCLICREALEATNSKTCPGRCARERKTQLQKQRRRRNRR